LSTAFQSSRTALLSAVSGILDALEVSQGVS